MKKPIVIIKAFAMLLVVAAIATFSSCSNSSGDTTALQTKIDSLQNEFKRVANEKALTEARLLRFDSLDFDFYRG